jgi:lipopolysaccharide biosynthesis regulator YciM
MNAEKFELLEAKVRETASLVTRLREDKQRLEHDNSQLQQRVAELEEALQQAQANESSYAPSLDNLLEQLDTLQNVQEQPRATPSATTLQELSDKEPKTEDDHFQLGTLYEQQGQYEQAIREYQIALDASPEHLDVAQRLAFLLEKLNRDAEASPLWDRIWAMRESQSSVKKRRLL